ncbi:hypothetical protein RJ639_018269 [Escallonia herrerae]|uniref:Uncharacterized protein n=1 Tax=Escallonia herrerae TaxID=1293975 RepID=A0AA88V971_9ASTE|nr:hypothetical protein RJ639_018269 [Escallonia herrerae]
MVVMDWMANMLNLPKPSCFPAPVVAYCKAPPESRKLTVLTCKSAIPRSPLPSQPVNDLQEMTQDSSQTPMAALGQLGFESSTVRCFVRNPRLQLLLVA